MRLKRKYNNTKIKCEDGIFDSKREYNRWLELKILEKAGIISELERQVPFTLIPGQKRQTPLKHGRKNEISVKYYADFTYMCEGKRVVEDTKGMLTPEYVIKRKLMLWLFGIEVQEI